jgi:hypothetical protein
MTTLDIHPYIVGGRVLVTATAPGEPTDAIDVTTRS